MQAPARSQAAWLALTKLQPLQPREDVIPRPDLPGALCAAVTSHALTLVSAPAGYGKSTLLAGLVSAQPDLPLGDVYPPNLTPASHVGEMSDGMIFRAIRTGVVDDNRSTVKSTAGTRFLSDDDAWAIVAYLRHAPAVANDTPEFRPSFLLAVMAGARLVNLDPPATIAPVTAPPKAATEEYGAYVSAYMGCADCHGVNMDGQVKPPAPRGTNLRAVMPHGTKDQFFAAMRTGIDPGGRPIDAVMPWRSSAQLDDAELEALYQYLHGLSPLAGE